MSRRREPPELGADTVLIGVFVAVAVWLVGAAVLRSIGVSLW